MPDWKAVEAARHARAALLREQQRLAREAGITVARKPSTRPRAQAFEYRPQRTSTLEQYARLENLKRKPYSWMTTSPYA